MKLTAETREQLTALGLELTKGSTVITDTVLKTLIEATLEQKMIASVADKKTRKLDNRIDALELARVTPDSRIDSHHKALQRLSASVRSLGRKK